jgi:membrane protein implicated in regulation of membrane protease activity
MKEFFGTVAGIALWIGILVIAFGANTVIAVATGILGLIGVILFWKYLHGRQQERMYKESLSQQQSANEK